jgi:hypothetical protein
MTYTFKLARRLARLRSLSLALPLALLACMAEGPSDPGEPPPEILPATLDVTPSSASISPSQTLSFQAIAHSDSGEVVAVEILWSASGGTIDQDGGFQASSSGTYQIIATEMLTGLADTALVTVTSAPPPPPPPADTVVTRVIVSPGTVSTPTDQTVYLHAWGKNAAGDSLGVSVNWSASGGVVNAAGAFLAWSAGTYQVIAVLAGGSLADTATVTVTTPPPPPPPSGLTDECANPAAGWIWCDDFDQDRLASYFEYDAASGSFTRTAGVGNEGSTAMKASFTQGQTTAGALHLAIGKTPQPYFAPADAGTANYRELYWRVYVRYEAGWTGGGGHKMSRAFSFASPTSWAQAMIAHVWGGGNFLSIDPASGTDVAGNLQTTTYNDFPNLRWLGADASTTPIFDAAHVGAWYCIEAHVKLNSAGSSNGVFEMWIDGNLEASKTGLNWVGSFNQYGLNAVYLENYWNGGAPAGQTRYFDNFVVSTQPIGC